MLKQLQHSASCRASTLYYGIAALRPVASVPVTNMHYPYFHDVCPKGTNSSHGLGGVKRRHGLFADFLHAQKAQCALLLSLHIKCIKVREAKEWGNVFWRANGGQCCCSFLQPRKRCLLGPLLPFLNSITFITLLSLCLLSLSLYSSMLILALQ